MLSSAWRHRGLVLAIVIAFGLAAFLYTSFRPSEYLAEATVVLEDPEVVTLAGTTPVISGDRLVANQLEVVQSGAVARRAAQLASDQGHDVTPSEIIARTSFETLRGTDVIVIGFLSADPNKAEAVANAVVAAYDQIQREQRQNANAAVESRLDQADELLGQELASINEQVDALLAGRGLGTKIDSVLDRIAGLQQQLSESTDTDTRESILNLLEQEDRQLDILRSALDVETGRSDVAALLLNRTLVQDRMIEVDSQRSSIAIQTEIEGSGIAFVSPATTTNVSSGAGVVFTTLGGAFVGLLIAFGVAYSLNSWRRGFSSATEGEAILTTPVLAEIPKWESDTDTLLPVRDAPRSTAAEAFRFAAANLEVRTENGRLKSVYFASAGVGDGKSTLVANIAAAAARTKRVLVIDADFGSQELSKLLVGDFKMEPGLTDLAAESVDVQAAVSRINLSESVELSLLGRGTDPITAPDFFGKKSLEKIIGEVSKGYDLVLIDGPPLLQVAYASALSRVVSATVMVIQHGSTIRSGSELVKRLRFLNANVIGFFYNRAPARGNSDSNGGSMRDILGDRGLMEPIQRPRVARR